MLLFLALSLDVLVVLVLNNIIGQNALYKHVACNTVTSIIWCTTVIISFKYINKNNIKEIYSLKVDTHSIILFFIFSCLLIIINLIVKNSTVPNFINEFSVLYYKYKEFGLITYIMRNLYYLLESMLITLIIIFSQEWGEKKFSNRKLPYGGIVLCLSWGLIHILTKGLMTGLYAAAISIILGISFVSYKKNIIFTFILVLIIFLI